MVLLLMKDLKGLLVMFYCTEELRENNVFVTESSTNYFNTILSSCKHYSTNISCVHNIQQFP